MLNNSRNRRGYDRLCEVIAFEFYEMISLQMTKLFNLSVMMFTKFQYILTQMAEEIRQRAIGIEVFKIHIESDIEYIREK